MSKKPAVKSIVREWGVSGQNNMTDTNNDYNHLTKTGEKDKVAEQGDHVILYRGKENHAPQKDIELGRRSITHKSIAEKMVKLVCGKGLSFRIKKPDNDNGELTDFETALIEEAEELLKMGLSDCFKDVVNGVVYHNLANIIATQNRASFSETREAVYNTIAWLASQPSERMRWSEHVMTEKATEIIPYHYYHNDWGFTGDCKKAKKTPAIISIEEYITASKSGDRPKEAFYVHTADSPEAKKQSYVSFVISSDRGIFDGAYPIPRWKSNSSINDIQNEFEASCIRTDFLRNGLHVFAVVNVYSTSFNITTENDEDNALDDWADSLEVVKALKSSHNSGKVIVNALGTKNPEDDGKIEVEKIDIAFPAEVYKALAEDSSNGVLTAWGVIPDLFGISKQESNSLRSQGEAMKIGILMLKEDVSLYQRTISNGINRMLKFYGMEEVEAFVEENESSLYLSIIADIAKEYMRINEVRKQIIGTTEFTDKELAEFIEEKVKFGSSQKKKDSDSQPKEEDDE